MKQAERREAISGAGVVYIYHNTIDAVGDKAATEDRVFDACEQAISGNQESCPHDHKRHEGHEHSYHCRPWLSVFL